MKSLLMRRGNPLLVFALVLAIWAGARAMIWRDDAFAALRPGPVTGAASGILSAEAAVPAVAALVSPFSPWPGGDPAPPAAGLAPAAQLPHSAALQSQPEARSNAEPAGLHGSAGWFGFFLPAGLAAGRVPPVEGAWHSSVEIAEADTVSRQAGGSGHGRGGNVAPAFAAAVRRAAASRHWSGDAWLLVRQDTGSLAAVGPGLPSYGADQSGGVLRYALSLRDPHRLAAYARVTTALHDSNESELALGLQGRPFPKIPILALGEVRVARDGGTVFARPAAMAVTQLPPLALPYGTLGDAYLQAGYVGGRNATAFVDGQIHLKKRIGKLGKGDWSLGAGGWGGAQTGASRLDLGPEATWHVPLKHGIAANLSLDYRVKIAGNAQPGSGPALSLAAGF
jgi:hypothetical protein